MQKPLPKGGVSYYSDRNRIIENYIKKQRKQQFFCFYLKKIAFTISQKIIIGTA